MIEMQGENSCSAVFLLLKDLRKNCFVFDEDRERQRGEIRQHEAICFYGLASFKTSLSFLLA